MTGSMGDKVADTDARVRLLVAKVLRRAAVTSTASWQELGVDSLDLVEIVTAAEEAFACSVPDRELLRLHTPLELADYISSLAGATLDSRSVESECVTESRNRGGVVVASLVDVDHGNFLR
jgi:acyl carrier protein